MRFLTTSPDLEPFARVLRASGHDATFWDQSATPAFDVFALNRIDAVLAYKHQVDRALSKCFDAHKNIKQLVFLPAKPDKHFRSLLVHGVGVAIMPAADILSYRPGFVKPEFECDVAFIGDRLATPEHDAIIQLTKSMDVKIFGRGWGVPQCLGTIDQDEDSDIFASADITIHVEDDSLDRPFNVLISGGSCQRVDHVQVLSQTLRQILYDDTYFERTIDVLEQSGIVSATPSILQAKAIAVRPWQ